jgi:hypothetical protein
LTNLKKFVIILFGGFLTVEIKVKGFEASIIQITSSASPGLTAIIQFRDPSCAHGLKRFGVGIPPQDLTREELISIITEEAEKKLEAYLRERKREEVRRREWIRFEKLAQEMNEMLGLKPATSKVIY